MKILDSYIKGQLSPSELEQFSAALTRIQLDAEKKADWAKKLAKNQGVYRSQKRTYWKNRTGLLWIIFLLGALVLGALLLFQGQKQAPATYQQMAQNYIQTMPIMGDQMVTRKGATQEETWRIKANEAFVDKAYPAAIKYWTLLQENQKATGFDQFYLALCYLRISSPQPGRAISTLEEAESRQPILQQEIQWVKALAYLINDQPVQAKPLLEKIVSQQAYMHRYAQELLLKMAATDAGE